MRFLLGLTCVLCCTSPLCANEAIDELSRHLHDDPALVLVVCQDDAVGLRTIAPILNQTPWVVLCQTSNDQSATRLRGWARKNGFLGQRIWIVQETGTHLWLADDMADAVWIAADVSTLPDKGEILRVLHPGGVSVAAGSVQVKPVPAGVDQWRHPYHGPDNNVVSQDQKAKLPGELRFQTRPVFASMPNQTLFAGGRIFFFSGHIAFHQREEPLLNTLTVLNAYNGLPLWKRPLDPDFVVHNIAKFATDRNVVYAEGPTLWRLDAANGEVVGKYTVPAVAAAAGDTDWKWVVQKDDKLWAAFGPPDAHVAPHRQRWPMGHWPWSVANQQYRGLIDNFGAARRLALYQYPEMRLLWSVSESTPFDARSLCLEKERIFQFAPSRYMVARDANTGSELWRQTPATAKKLFDTIGIAIRRQGWGLGWATYCCARAGAGVVCIAGPSYRKTFGINFADGTLLWSLPVESPHAFFLNDGLHVVPRVAARTALCQHIDPISGQVLDQFDLGVIGSCTRLTATADQFFYRPGGGIGTTVYANIGPRKLANYTGVVRPGCFDGVVPANGRLYWMPLACDCWQTHGTFCMAPRKPLDWSSAGKPVAEWRPPTGDAPAATDDWPMFRANSAGTATVSAHVPRSVRISWQRDLSPGVLTAPVCAAGQGLIGADDGTVTGLDATTGETLWQTNTQAAVLYPPAYWKGCALVGSCDGFLYSIDATNGQIVGRLQLAPEKRLVNIMNRLVSAWPVGGGVVIDNGCTAYTVAGSTAADGCIAAAVDAATGKVRWRQVYSPDDSTLNPSFGVQGNILLHNDTLFVNGGSPVGMVAIAANGGENARVISELEAGRNVFLQPDGNPCASGSELYSNERTRTTIFKRHQGRIYFQMADRHIALIQDRLFCADKTQTLDRIVELVNKDPNGGKMIATTVPWDIMTVPLDKSILWASNVADLRGLAVGADGVVVLHQQRVEGIALDGTSLWSVQLEVPPVSWGIALTGDHCLITLTNGHVLHLASTEPR